MRKIVCCLILCLFCVTGCYEYYYVSSKEVNNNGISNSKIKRSIRKKYLSSYASDGVRVRNVCILPIQDTISKRCFTSADIKFLKKTFLKDSLLAKNPFHIELFRYIDLEKCIGLFDVNFYGILQDKSLRITVPLLKLQDTIFVNGIQGIEINSQMEDYIRKNLLNSFDSTEVELRMGIFNAGKRVEYNKIKPSRLYR